MIFSISLALSLFIMMCLGVLFFMFLAHGPVRASWISPGISLEGMMLKLKLQYFGHLMRRVDSLEKTVMLGGIGGKRRSGRQDEMAGWHH